MGLDTVETVLWAEQAFGIEIPDEDAAAIRTVGEFARCIQRRAVSRDGAEALSEAQVFERIKAYLVSEFRLEPDRITPDAEFVRDLGMD